MKSARQRYKSDLNAKWKLDQAAYLKENKGREVQSLNEKIGSINEHIQLTHYSPCCFSIPPENIRKPKGPKIKKMSKEKLQQPQSMIVMGLDWKRKLESEIKD